MMMMDMIEVGCGSHDILMCTLFSSYVDPMNSSRAKMKNNDLQAFVVSPDQDHPDKRFWLRKGRLCKSVPLIVC